MTKNKSLNTFKSVTAVCAAIACAVSVCACGAVNWISKLDDGVSQHTELQSAYLNDDYKNISKYATGTAELSRPQAVEFKWDDMSADGYTLELSENGRFTSPLVYDTQDTAIELYNLKIGKTYYWRVTAKMSDGTLNTSNTSTFTTEDVAPRNIYVDGITNVRDLGGWKTVDGKSVKQGMIYRCGRLNKSRTKEVEIEISDAGIRTMRDELGICTEIDLRRTDLLPDKTYEYGGITRSPLGPDINYKQIPMGWANNENAFDYLTDPRFYPAIKEFFKVAADPENYPIIFHCDIGTDRTGLFAFLINGLVGVSEEDLYREYTFSNFGNIGKLRSVSNIKPYVDAIKKCDGDSFSEKIQNCLLDIGVPFDDIDAVIYNMTDI